ncbi:MAG TPA: alpha/beta fold hydrolase, partial [Verrucomicrobiae bacterium]|nr:alpha/beta fold hydrolase [Verrucomicrobiae bacterium]
MTTTRKSVRLRSQESELAGELFLPVSTGLSPAMIICHGAGEFKENYFELCEFLAARGIIALAIDLRGHGESQGERYHVKMKLWSADVSAAIDFLQTTPGVDVKRIGGFGLSSGGTALLEAAAVDPRLRTLVILDGTVRNSLPFAMTAFLKSLVYLGHVKKFLTRSDLRLPLAKLGKFEFASDPEIAKKLEADPRLLAAFMSFPFPGGGEAFFVDTLHHVSGIKAATMVLWGEDDKLDPPESGK